MYRTAAFGEQFGFTNCYIVAAPGAVGALVVDPGQGALPWVLDQLRANNLTAEAILLTHGHMDHTWDAQPLAERLRVPVILAHAGHSYLDSPEDALPPTFPMHLLKAHPHRRPTELIEPPTSFQVADMTIRCLPTPGHTPCSVTYLIDVQETRLVCTGDTLLAGGQPGTPVPPGGNAQLLRESLSRLRDEVAGATVLPGHGRQFVTQAHRRSLAPSSDAGS